MFFTYEIGNLKLRSCDEHLVVSENPHSTAEIIIRHDDKVFTIASWRRGKEGFDLHYVGSRPFINEVDSIDFMSLSRIGQSFLDAVFLYEDRL